MLSTDKTFCNKVYTDCKQEQLKYLFRVKSSNEKAKSEIKGLIKKVCGKENGMVRVKKDTLYSETVGNKRRIVRNIRRQHRLSCLRIGHN